MAYRKQIKKDIKLILWAIVSLISLGTFIFHLLEGWSLIDSFYFVTMTATTVGYGDFIPTHPLSKIITVFYSLLIIPIILYAFSIIAKFEIERVNRQIYGIEKKQRFQKEELEKTEKRILAQRRKIKEQEAILKQQIEMIEKQKKINRMHEKEITEVGDIMGDILAEGAQKK